MLTRSGKEQIAGFYFAGEILGLEGIYTQRHRCYATALENSHVCIIPFQRLETLCQHIESLQHHLFCVMSKEIARKSNILLLLGSMMAEERVAAFLLDISQRLKVQGDSDMEFTLCMRREEIGEYLGLKLETVSRILSKFQNNNILEIHGKQIRIINLQHLMKISPNSSFDGRP